MANKRDILRNQDSGFVKDLVLRVKLIWRLVRDKRVNPFLKIVPVVGLIYLISPIDLIPDIALPVIGYLDDAVVIWLSMTLFVALCPDEVVQEHMNVLQKVVTGTWRDVPAQDALDKGIQAETNETREKHP
jgi:uncharacterized membrane protein YkvA (DUF1232 family)